MLSSDHPGHTTPSGKLTTNQKWSYYIFVETTPAVSASPARQRVILPNMELHLQLLFAILPLIISPAFAKTCCSSPQPSQPILCSSPNSCILRGLGNTSGWLEDHCHKAWPRQDKDKDQDKTKTKTSVSCDVLTRDPRRRGGVSTHPG